MAINLNNLANETPKTIDTELARVHRALYAFYGFIREARDNDKQIAKYERAGMLRGRNGEPHYLVTRKVRLDRRARVALAIIARIRRELIDPLNDEFCRRPWTRFHMVSGGHIHLASKDCFTLRPTTMIGWLPEDSGNGEEETIRKYGVGACTHCFPDAPVLPVSTAKIVDGKCSNKTFIPGRKSDHRMAYRRATCDHCGTWASITKNNELRKHKVKK